MRPMLLSLSFLLAFSFAAVGQKKVSATYDKFKDRTMISADGANRIQPTKAFVGQLFFNVFSFHPGEKVTALPEYVILTFFSSSDRWRYLRSNDLRFLLDGERLELGKGDHEGTVNDRLSGPAVSERVYFQLTIADAEKIVRAKKVEIQLGPFEGKFDESDKELIAAVLKAVTPPKQP